MQDEVAEGGTSIISEPDPTDLKEMETGSISIVTAYYRLHDAKGRFKHSTEEYNEWLKASVGSFNVTIFLFTSPDLEGFFTELRSPNLLPLHIITTFPTVWDNPFASRVRDDYENAQQAMDPEKSFQTPEMYALWNSKSWLLNYTAHNFNHRSSVLFWVDAGAVRIGSHYHNWPYVPRVAEIFKGSEDKIIIEAVFRFPSRLKSWNVSDGPVTVDILAGGFFGGSPASISKWTSTYQLFHDRYLADGFFVGKDQSVMIAVALSAPHMFRFIPECFGSCSVSWFLFLSYFSSPEEHPSDCPLPALQDLSQLWDDQ